MGVEVCEAVATGEDVSLAFGSTQSLRTLGESVVDIIGESAEVASFDGAAGVTFWPLLRLARVVGASSS